ncbi:heavy metal translocating P-type ATPase [Ectothiorhodospiraceae bacterium 2226]|nr:heavy metal translocating P-type ATPase [Ectothiorhodospiraceae bacterium 2226]
MSGAPAADASCFHCGLPVPPGSDFRAQIDGEPRAMCCAGCQAVAEAIVEAGLDDFYRHRSGAAPGARERVPEALRRVQLYDQPAVQASFVREAGEYAREADLILEGITCAACVWLNERHVSQIPGVLEFRVNYTTHRAHLRWDERQVRLSDVLRAIAAIGYVAHPYDPQRQASVHQRERRLALRRLAVAGVGMMQVMMLAVALYAGPAQGMDASMEAFLRWMSLLIATPVVFYAGLPFFQNAWRDVRRRRAGMDVPVALAVGSTYVASAWATYSGGGEIYFESATMFVFFLLMGRFLEMNARHRAGQSAEHLGGLLPVTATRLLPDGELEIVAPAQLQVGDRVQVLPGDTVPADARVVEGRSALDESLLSGESLPRTRGVGDAVVGGSINTTSPLILEVEKVGQDTTLSAIQRLLDRAQTEKPRLGRLAERGTGRFVVAVLVLTALVGLAWTYHQPEHAFWVMVAMLVVSCPCALALATPVAVTAATGALTRRGVLTTRGHALETLADVSDVVLDKTGTLTEGRLRLQDIQPLSLEVDPEQALALAARLEAASEHPLALALRAAADERGLRGAAAHTVEAFAGEGVEGRVDDRTLRIGSPAFVLGEQALPPRLATLLDERPDASVVLLGERHRPLAAFVLADTLRAGAMEAVAGLLADGLQVHVLSGDRPATVAWLADRLGIAQARGGLSPTGKLEYLRDLQAQGRVVAMVGDGVNDAPVLAHAHVSLAMAGGTRIAQASADMILFSEHLPHLLEARNKAREAVRIIRQNIYWAIGYNVVALPVAAAGVLTPWLAALGMSASSLLVVLNALRLLDRRGPRPRPGASAAGAAVRAGDV